MRPMLPFAVTGMNKIPFGPTVPLLFVLASSCSQVEAPVWPITLTVEPVSFRLPVPEPVRQAARRVTAQTVQPICFLRFEGIVLDPGRSAQVRIFLNRPDATIATGTESEGFTGFLAIVPPASDQGGRPLSFTLDVGPRLASALSEPEVVLTLVPLGDPGGSSEELSLQIGAARLLRP